MLSSSFIGLVFVLMGCVFCCFFLCDLYFIYYFESLIVRGLGGRGEGVEVVRGIWTFRLADSDDHYRLKDGATFPLTTYFALSVFSSFSRSSCLLLAPFFFSLVFCFVFLSVISSLVSYFLLLSSPVLFTLLFPSFLRLLPYFLFLSLLFSIPPFFSLPFSD